MKITMLEVEPIFYYYLNCLTCFEPDRFYCDGSSLNMGQWSFYDIDEFHEKLSKVTKDPVTLWPEK